jgi:hypothetical protein
LSQLLFVGRIGLPLYIFIPGRGIIGVDGELRRKVLMIEAQAFEVQFLPCEFI